MTDLKHTFDCTDIAAVLSALVDDELPPPQRHSAERHIATCVACRKSVEEAERLDALVAAQVIEEPALPPDFEVSVLARTVLTDRLLRPRSRLVMWTGWLAAAACLALAIALWQMPQKTLTSSGVAHAQQEGQWAGSNDAPQSGDAERAVLAEMSRAINSPPPGSFATHRLAPTRPRIDPEAVRMADDVAFVLADLATIDGHDDAAISRLRQSIEQGKTLEAIARARTTLPAAHRPAVLAVESVLIRFMQDPIANDVIHSIQTTIEELELIDSMRDLASRVPGSLSL